MNAHTPVLPTHAQPDLARTGTLLAHTSTPLDWLRAISPRFSPANTWRFTSCSVAVTPSAVSGVGTGLPRTRKAVTSTGGGVRGSAGRGAGGAPARAPSWTSLT